MFSDDCGACDVSSLQSPSGGCRVWQLGIAFLEAAYAQIHEELEPMKHVLGRTAIAAALFFAAPVWTQASAAPMRPSAAPSVTSAPNHSMGSPMRMHQVKARRHRTMRGGGASASDNIANQLNAQEVARNSGGGMAPAPAPRAMRGAPGGPTGPYGQPNQIYGMP